MLPLWEFDCLHGSVLPQLWCVRLVHHICSIFFKCLLKVSWSKLTPWHCLIISLSPTLTASRFTLPFGNDFYLWSMPTLLRNHFCFKVLILLWGRRLWVTAWWRLLRIATGYKPSCCFWILVWWRRRRIYETLRYLAVLCFSLHGRLNMRFPDRFAM